MTQLLYVINGWMYMVFGLIMVGVYLLGIEKTRVSHVIKMFSRGREIVVSTFRRTLIYQIVGIVLWIFYIAGNIPETAIWIWVLVNIILYFLMLLIVTIGYYYLDTYTVVAEKYRIKDRFLWLTFTTFFLFMMMFAFKQTENKFFYCSGMIVSTCVIVMVFRSAIFTLKRSHIRAIPIEERSKALFFIAGYWLVNLLIGIFFFLCNFKQLFPDALLIDKKPPTTADLLYFTVTSLTPFGNGEMTPGSGVGQVIMALVALIGFSYPVFFLSAFFMAYTQDEQKPDNSNATRGRRIRSNRNYR